MNRMSASLVSRVLAMGLVLLAGAAGAQYPVMDAVANKVIQKYQNSTCEQLWQEKAQKQGQAKPEMEQRVVQLLRNDPADLAEKLVVLLADPGKREHHEQRRQLHDPLLATKTSRPATTVRTTRACKIAAASAPSSAATTRKATCW